MSLCRCAWTGLTSTVSTIYASGGGYTCRMSPPSFYIRWTAGCGCGGFVESTTIQHVCWRPCDLGGCQSQCGVACRPTVSCRWWTSIVTWLLLGTVFQQDKTPQHTVRLTTAFLQNAAVDVLLLPSMSPDMNIIEHAWRHIASEINMMEYLPATTHDLWQCIHTIWWGLPRLMYRIWSKAADVGSKLLSASTEALLNTDCIRNTGCIRTLVTLYCSLLIAYCFCFRLVYVNKYLFRYYLLWYKNPIFCHHHQLNNNIAIRHPHPIPAPPYLLMVDFTAQTRCFAIVVSCASIG